MKYKIDIYIEGIIVKSYKNLIYEDARNIFLNHSKCWENYPLVYIDGIPQTIKKALEHFKIKGSVWSVL